MLSAGHALPMRGAEGISTSKLFSLCLVESGSGDQGTDLVVTRLPEMLIEDFAQQVWLVTGRLPYWTADYLAKRVELVLSQEIGQAADKTAWLRWLRLSYRRESSALRCFKRVRKEIRAVAKELGIVCQVTEFGWKDKAPRSSAAASCSHDLRAADRRQMLLAVNRLVVWFAGRRLREEELFSLVWRRGGRWELPFLKVLEYACLSGAVVRTPGIIYRGYGRWQCGRCGETREIELIQDRCPVCGRIGCPICCACAGMGLVRGCEPVYEFRKVLPADGVPGWKANMGDTEQLPVLAVHAVSTAQADVSSEPVLPFSLAESQAKASRELVEFLATDQRICLLWAVCGAGKTETVFAAMAQVLAAGGRVLFTIPRRDVVLELAPRLQKAFPNRKVTVLVGGQGAAAELGDIVVATTHQTLRLGAVFGLVILDEADAFPYASDPALVRSVQRCVAPGGKQVIMTATPDAAHLVNVRAGLWRLVVIPVRHHGHLLPVPKVLLHRSWGENRRNVQLVLPHSDSEQNLSRGAADASGDSGTAKSTFSERFPLMIFVPTIAHGRFLHRYLLEAWPGTRVEFVYAEHPYRDKLTDAFRLGEIPVLVCTSILSRGVTIPKVNVWVAWADVEHVLDAASLVQMAGRVGRTTACPDGEVWFMAGRETRSMRQAVEMIQQANAWAQGMTRTMM